MSETPTIYQPNQPIPSAPGGLLPAGEDNYAVPVLRIAQPVSQIVQDQGIRAGMLYCKETGEQWEKFQAVVCKVAETRTLWSADNLPACQSLDGLSPVAGGSYPGPCKECEKRHDMPWVLNPEGRRDWCLRGYALAMVTEGGVPYVLRVSGVSMSVVRNLNTLFKVRYQWRPYATLLEFSSAPAKSALGSYYVLTAQVARDLDTGEIARYEEIARGIVGMPPPEEGKIPGDEFDGL